MLQHKIAKLKLTCGRKEDNHNHEVEVKYKMPR